MNYKSAEVTAYFDRLTNDPAFFVQEVFASQRKAGWAKLGEVEEDAINFTYGVTSDATRRGVLMYRNAGKTHWGTICLTLYRLFRDPYRRVVVISKSSGAAQEMILSCRQLIDDVWFLNHLRPKADRRDNSKAFDVGPLMPGAKQPSVKALGIDGQLSTNRAHTVIADDVETEQNAMTPEARIRLKETVTEFRQWLFEERNLTDEDKADGFVAPVDPPEIVYFGTPKHEDTLYLALSKKNVAMRGYPIQLPAPDENVINLAPMLVERLANGGKPGDPTAPHRFGVTAIADFMSEGMHKFKREQMLIADLGQTNRYPMRLSDLMVHECPRDKAPVSMVWGTRDNVGSTDTGLPTLGPTNDRLYRPIFVDPNFASYNVTKAGIDPAGRGADRTGLTIAGELGGLFFVKHNCGLSGTSDETCLEIARRLREYGATEAYFEVNIDSTGAWEQVMRGAIRKLTLQPGVDPRFPQGWNCTLTDVRSHGQKELRIIGAVEPLLSSHRIVVDPSVVAPHEPERHLEFQYQLACMTRDRGCLVEDGRIDSLAILLRAWIDGTSTAVLSTGEKGSLDQQRRIAALEEEVDEHIALLEGRGNHVATYGDWIYHG